MTIDYKEKKVTFRHEGSFQQLSGTDAELPTRRSQLSWPPEALMSRPPKRVRRTPDSEQGPSLAEGSLRVHQLLVLPWHGFVYSAVRGRPRFTLEPRF